MRPDGSETPIWVINFRNHAPVYEETSKQQQRMQAYTLSFLVKMQRICEVLAQTYLDKIDDPEVKREKIVEFQRQFSQLNHWINTLKTKFRNQGS